MSMDFVRVPDTLNTWMARQRVEDVDTRGPSGHGGAEHDGRTFYCAVNFAWGSPSESMKRAMILVVEDAIAEHFGITASSIRWGTRECLLNPDFV